MNQRRVPVAGCVRHGGVEREGPRLPGHQRQPASRSVQSRITRGEDDGLFTELLDARPDLALVIQNLIDDHVAIAAILRQVRALATEAKTAPAEVLPRLRRELDGPAAIADSHFGYEERAISAALDNDVQDSGWSRPVFRLTGTQ